MFHALISTYLKPLEAIDEARPAHLEWLRGEVEAGRILLAGRQESQTGGVLITGDISAEEADALVARDPFTKAGLARYERVSFAGVVRAPGL
ncbi:YciI family protein [uncultured Mycolicibacterium sp.]|uniref:YciI family protein n=1 Tax=uncultured Mycolicibacterium sp. TaxID=2320817 RepID=UPI00262942BB|nr:YciI family protein [uncultured Mycolicibacterium sp.]